MRALVQAQLKWVAELLVLVPVALVLSVLALVLVLVALELAPVLLVSVLALCAFVLAPELLLLVLVLTVEVRLMWGWKQARRWWVPQPLAPQQVEHWRQEVRLVQQRWGEQRLMVWHWQPERV